MRTALALCALAAAIAAPVAASGGGPSPGISWGWDGVAGPGGQLRYVTLPAGNGTLVEAVRVHDGRIMRWTSIKGSYGVPLVAYDGSAGGLSHDARTLVLGSYPGFPGPSAATRFAVLDAMTLRVRTHVTLRGAFSYDALSPNGSTMYLIQYTSTQNANRYRVRAYDLAAGRLLARVIVDRREPKEQMSGSPVTRVTSSDGAWVYTLYARSSGPSFIHALDTVRREAVCIDLSLRAVQDVRLALTADQKQIMLLQRRGRVHLLTIAAPG